MVQVIYHVQKSLVSFLCIAESDYMRYEITQESFVRHQELEMKRKQTNGIVFTTTLS